METLEGTWTVGLGARPARGALVEVFHLLLSLECDRPTAPPVRFALDDVSRVELGRGGSREWSRNRERGLRIDVPDRRMSQLHAVVSREPEGYVIEDQGSKNGTLVNGSAVRRAILADGDRIQLGHTTFLFKRLPAEIGGPAVVEAASLGQPPALRTLNPALAKRFEELERVARSNVPILILGETGTGKELVARSVHQLSGRHGPFVAVNCGALPETLVESELFGAQRGAFSGAHQERAGLVRASDKGTLLLDEIGDLPLAPQAALLRVLQEREVLPVGATRPITVDTRFLAATHHDVDTLVARGRFRADLFARLNGFSIKLPALRERPEDLCLLVASLLVKIAGPAAASVTLAPEAAQALLAHAWPMNVRELEKCLEAAWILASGGQIALHHLPESVRTGTRPSFGRISAALSRVPGPSRWGADAPSSSHRPDPLVRDRLVDQLRAHNGNVSAVARAMGKARMQIQRWIRQHGIDVEAYRS